MPSQSSQFIFPSARLQTKEETFTFPSAVDSGFVFPSALNIGKTDIEAIMDAIGKFEDDYSFGNLNYTDELAERFGATEGPEYTDHEGKTYTRAKFPSPELGEDAARWRAKQIWKDVDKDPVQFVSTWTGLKEDDETVVNFADEIQRGLPPEKVEPELEVPDPPFTFPSALSSPREVPFLGPREMPERTKASLGRRFKDRFFEYLAPFELYDPNLPEAEYTREIVADLAGGFSGMLVGFAGLGAVTGGATWIGAPAKGVKAVQLAKTARTLVKAGRMKGAAKYLGIGSSGLLGRSPWVGRNYLNTMAKLTVTSPRLAKAVDLGARNIITFGTYGQLMLPTDASIVDRMKTAEHDFYSSLLFGAAGLPKILQIPKATAVEAGLLLAAGAGSDFGQDKDRTAQERIIHGLALTGFHFARQKAGKVYVEGKMRNALIAWGYTPKEAERILADKTLLNNVMRAGQGKTTKEAQRPFEEQNIFANKDKKLKQNVDLINIYTNKKGQAMAVYRDLELGTRHTTTAKDFFSGFSKVNKSKTILEKEREKGLIVDDKAPSEVVPKKGEKGYDAWSRGRRQVKLFQKKAGLSDKDYRKVLNILTGKNSSTELTPREMARALEVMKPVKNFRKADAGLDGMEAGLLDKIPEGLRMGFSKLAFPASATLRGIARKFNSKTALKLSDSMLDFALKKAPIRAFGTKFLKGIKQRYKLSREDLKSVVSIIDPEKFGKYPITKKIKSGKVVNEKGKEVKIKDGILKDYNAFMKMNFLWMANAGVEVRIFSKSRMGSRYVPIWQGKYKNTEKNLPEKDYKRLQKMKKTMRTQGKTSKEIKERVNQFLTNTVTGPDVKNIGVITKAKAGDMIKLKDGREVKLTSVESRRLDDYYPRVLTAEAMTEFGTNKSFRNRMLESLKKHDPELQKIKSATKKHQKAEKMLNSMMTYIDERGVFGSQIARRKIDLPSRVAFDKDGIDIPLKDYNVKKGDLVNGRKIEKIIDVYHRDFVDVISRYSEKVSHVVPTYEYFGRKGVKGAKAQSMITKISDEVKGDKGVENWVIRIIEQQANGMDVQVPKVLQGVWSFAANIGLSAPKTGFKNLLLGQVQTFTTFSARQMAKAYKEILTDKKKWKAVTKSVGADEMSIHELEAMKTIQRKRFKRVTPIRWLGRMGGMQETESFNRLGAAVTGLFTAREAIKVLTGQITPWQAKMSKAQARHYLENTFRLDVKKILASKRRTLTKNEETKIMQMSHIMSQGSPELPFIPSWMAKGWAKPLTLFYRTAYRITENVGQNVVRPLLEQGNPLPSMKYLSGSALAGAGMVATNYLALQKGSSVWKSDQYHDIGRDVIDYMYKAETLAVLGFVTDEDWTENFIDKFFIVRMLSEAKNQFSYITNGSKTPYNASVDWAKSNIPVFNDIVTVWENNAKPEYAEVKRFRRMQNDWSNAVGDVKDSGVYPRTVRKRSYEAIEASFWGSDKDQEKADLYYVELTDVANSLEKDRWTCLQAKDLSRTNLRTAIESTRPVTLSHETLKAGKSDYRRFVLSLAPKDRKRLLDIEKKWQAKSDSYWNAVGNNRHLEVKCSER